MNQKNHTALPPDRSVRRMPIVTCSCGVDILIVPDLKATVKAVKMHEPEHHQITGRQLNVNVLSTKIIEELSEQLL